MNIVLAERLRVTVFVLGCLVVFVGAGLFMASSKNRENDRWVAKAEQLERALNSRYAEEIRYERGAQRVTFLMGGRRGSALRLREELFVVDGRRWTNCWVRDDASVGCRGEGPRLTSISAD
ncbi:hypothetical protein [uncultured Nocardioides sp.]|uniref:hypothetical protein n=1 Tax=uncultured Nocardioides sp. TaxID=198441 RepID=UPI000C4A54B4|nr:hypothetical protein [Nocardioides sp.]|tara:strand:- start:104 stop:466 length:363 start_codon:yes stop_codon:yes gene_type:complete